MTYNPNRPMQRRLDEAKTRDMDIAREQAAEILEDRGIDSSENVDIVDLIAREILADRW